MMQSFVWLLFMGLKWGLLYKMTGSLWVGLGDHLFNNVIGTNHEEKSSLHK